MTQKYQPEALQTPMKKAISKSQVYQSENERLQEQTMQKYNLPLSQRIQRKNELDLKLTPRPERKIYFYDQNKNKHYFPLFKDSEIGINKKLAKYVIQSWNDDDKQTSDSQLIRGKDQTMQDLYQVLKNSQFQSSQNSSFQMKQFQKEN